MDRRTLLALVTVQTLFGLLPVAGKLVFATFHPLALGAIRVSIAAVILVVVQHFLADRRIDLRRDGIQVAVLALFGVVLNQTLFVVGLEKTTTVNAVLIITCIPVVTYAIAVFMGRETWGPRRLFGMLLALLGVVYLIGLSSVSFGWDNALGDILVFVNCFCFSLYLVLSKPLASKVNPLNLVAWQFVMASAVMVPLGLWFGLLDQVQVASSVDWWLVGYIIVGPTVGTYVLNATALRHVTSSTVAVFIYIQPLFTAIAAWFFLDERLTWKLLPAALLVFVGVGIVAWRSRVAAEAVPQE